MARCFMLFFSHFVIGPISYWKINLNILVVYILVKRLLEKQHHPQWGPNKRGAASKAEQPLFVQKKQVFTNYQKLVNLY